MVTNQKLSTSLAVNSKTELYRHSLKNCPRLETLSRENCMREPLASSNMRSIFTLQSKESSAAFLMSPFLRLLKVIYSFRVIWIILYMSELRVSDLLDCDFSSSHFGCNWNRILSSLRI